ncbi:MAG TPA: BTAD domain-containing putative transcriptional regulator, partial [Actinocrinis sp.]|nr:BTAD domain-containing putative transcriptional regulator [Actinocrinis sp.]
QPQRIKHRRTGGDVVKGLGAFLALAVLLGAIPFALVRYIGWPLPHHMPTADMFNRPITPHILLDALAVIVWLAWAQFAACVVVEFVAAKRGIGMPAHVPGAGPSQFLARQLVAALLLITASAASFVPNLAHLGAHPAPAASPVVAAAGRLPAANQHTAIAASAPHTDMHGVQNMGNLPAVRGESGLRVADNSASVASLSATKLYRVQPPHGRHHDSLWEIAQRHLGDGRRYKEIFELNKERVQPDGSRLTHAALIRPGWILMMPADATGGDLVVEPAPISPNNLSPAQTGGIQVNPGQSGATQPDQSQGTNTLGAPAAPQSGHALPSQSAFSLGSGGAGGSQTSPSSLSPVPSSPPPTITGATAPGDGAQTVQAAPDAADSQDGADSKGVADTPAPTRDDAQDQATQDTQTAAVAQSADEIAKLASAAAAAAVAEPHAAEAPAEPSVPTPRPVTPPVASPRLLTPVPATGLPAQGGPNAPAQSAQAAAPAAPATPVPPAPSGQAVPRVTAVPLPQAPARAQIAPPSQSAGSRALVRQNTTTTGDAAIIPRPSHRGATSPEESQPPSTENRVLYGLAAAPLLAAGLLKALGRHRRRQLWNRVFGRRPVTASGDGAVAEESIRVGAGEVEVWFLDLALRGLSAGLAERGRSVPAAYAVRLRNEGIELLLGKPAAPDDPATAPPAPWFTAADGRSWNFPRPAIVDVDAQAAHRRFAPYPGLVTLGAVISPASSDPAAPVAANTDQLMIDLEEAHGLIGLDGPPEVRRAVLAALAVELATNSWSDRMTVTLVGFPGDLTPLAPARVRHVRTLDEILPSLEIEAVERAKALTAAGLDSVLDGRSRASQASSFPPHFVIVAEEPHAAILARLCAVATTAARVGLGLVVAGDVAGATWQLTVSSDGRITAPTLGIEAKAQLLPEEQYAAVLGLFRAVCDIEGTEVTAEPVHQSVGYSTPLPDEPPSVYVGLLGSLEVTGVGDVEPERAALLNEALVFLLHHRDGVHPRVLAAALWPRGATADVAEATFARLASWLGDDPTGQPNLYTDADGRLRLGAYVWSDWDVFVSLQSRALYDASIDDQQQRDQMLRAALDLVRGPYLADREPNRYGWLAYEVAEAQVPAVIADTALRLADSCISAEEPEVAIEAVKAGMRGSPDDEELWRGLLRATSATQDHERLRGAIEGLYKRTWYVHGVQGLHPRTEALVNELMPDWREVLAA